MKQLEKQKSLPPYLLEIRDKMVLELYEKGLSYQDIAVILSRGITRVRIMQIIKSKI